MKNTRSVKILIIDDEPGILRMLSFALSRKGYISETAENGTDGVEKFLSDTYHLVLTDMKMPDMTGEQVLHKLRKIFGNTVPIVGMSGTPWLLEGQSFDAVLEKPCSIKHLIAVVEDLLPISAKRSIRS